MTRDSKNSPLLGKPAGKPFSTPAGKPMAASTRKAGAAKPASKPMSKPQAPAPLTPIAAKTAGKPISVSAKPAPRPIATPGQKPQNAPRTNPQAAPKQMRPVLSAQPAIETGSVQKSALLTPAKAPVTRHAAPQKITSQPAAITPATIDNASSQLSQSDHPSGARLTPQPQAKLERQYLPSAAPRPRASLNKKSKAPSIGGLIHSIQAKPSNAPYYTAAITSLIWLFIGGLLGWLLVGQSLNDFTGYKSVLGSSSVYILAAAVLVPIALFWFIAQLVVRSHEMKLMASAMTEVAIRLAEPDKMAEQKVASVGQTIRRQVSAMDDAISRAIGRAGELEALVHNEVAALERSYSQNEYIIRNLLNELVNEREAIAHNGREVKQTLQGVATQVTRDIRMATKDIGDGLSQHGTMSALKLQRAGDQVTKALQTTTEQTVAIKQKISTELPQLLNKMNVEQQKLGKVIDGASKNLGQLDTSLASRTSDLDGKLAKRTAEIDGMIAKHTGQLNKRLVQKVKALDASLAMRTKAMDKTLASKAGEIDKTFLAHRDGIDNTMQQKAVEINQAIADQAKAMDASLTEKARTIDTALTQRLSTINEQTASISQSPPPQQQQPLVDNADLSMLRGSEALEKAMSAQSNNLNTNLEDNRNNLDQTINRQNELSPEITALTKKHNQLLDEHSAQVEHIREQFKIESADLLATTRLLMSPDMKMSAMMGPQQNKARAILSDIISRTEGLDKNRAAYARTLENSLDLGDETAVILKQMLTANASPRAQKAAYETDHGTALNLIETQELVKEMEHDYRALSGQVVETVSSMSRSRSQTKVLPGEVGNTSINIKKSVEEQLRALDALAQISGSAVHTNQASATATGIHTTSQGQGTQGLGQGQRPPTSRPGVEAAPARTKATGRSAGGDKKLSQWSFGDLLARVADTETEHEEQPLPNYRPATTGASPDANNQKSAIALDPLDVLRIDDFARALDSHTASMAWNRSQSGERNVFTKRLYTPEGQDTFDQISARYQTDGDFRNTVEKYVGDFEGMLSEASEKDPSGRIMQNYITSEAGRAYLLLAHISGRLG